MKKWWLILSLTIVVVTDTNAQYVEESPLAGQTFAQRLYYGGNLGLQFGTQTSIELSPMVGYRITSKLSAGVGLKYQYYQSRYYGTVYETNNYGGSVFGRFDAIHGLFAYSEYELLNLDRWDAQPWEAQRVNVGSFFVGGGYAQRVGGRASMSIMVLYNLTETRYTPYANNPIFRVGIGVGI